MAAYLIADVEVTHPEAYEEYRAKVPAVIAAYGGRYLVRGGACEVLEGEARARGLAGIGLHVFGHNPGARALDEKLGYETTNLHMFKKVPRADGP